MKKIVLFLSVVLLIFSACGTNSNDEKYRTVLVYMVADNNLSSNAGGNIDQMIKGAKSDDFLKYGNLVVYVDQAGTAKPLLLHIKQNDDGTIVKDTLEQYQELNSLDPLVVNDIILETVSRFNTKSYGLILWSHGTAWLPQGYQSMIRSFGVDKGQEMELPDLAKALPDGLFDFILFDACYMSSIEVAYALRNKADYIVASPTETIEWGFPYGNFMKLLFQQNLNLQAVCQMFYDYYANNPDVTGNLVSAAIALLDLSQIDGLTAITREILQGKEETIEEMPLENIQAMDYRSYQPRHLLYDFGDFIKHVATEEQYDRFQTELDKFVPFKLTTPTIYYASGVMPVEHFSGLSVYIPRKNFVQLNNWYQTNVNWYEAVFQ